MHQPAHQLGDVIVNIERTYMPDPSSVSIDHSNNNYEAIDLFGSRSGQGGGRERGGISRRFRTKTIKFRARIRRRKRVKRDERRGVKECKTGGREDLEGGWEDN